jgi:predicted transcriptional regulator
MVERPQLLAMAAEIVSAHVRYNAVAVDQLPGVIQQVFNALATAEQAVTPRPKTEPAVPVRRSVLADHVVCLDCGKHLTMLKRHLMTDHKLTPDQYRQRWELPFLVPIGRPELCQDPIHAREEVRAWSYGVSRTEEGRTKSCSEGGTASASHRVSLATVQQDASC